MRGRHSPELIVAIAAAFFLVAHLWSPRDSLEDIDSVNFALGVESYDLTRHQPHPPGYPVYIAGARAASALVHAVRPPSPSSAAFVLVLLAGLAGAVAVVVSGRVLAAAGCGPWTATTAALLFACAPLTWLTAARPLSDMPGLAAALVSQWLLVRLATPAVDRRLAASAFAGLWTGLAIGIRSQVLWLTLPIAGLIIVRHLRARLPRTAAVLIAGIIAGMLIWAVPMLLDTGGARTYLLALEDQAGDDFEGVPMLALQFGLERARVALRDSLVQPWGVPALAAAVLTAAMLGVVAFARRAPRVLATLVWLWLPYAVFHLLFQETETTRYALPLVLPLCALVAAALTMAIGRWHRPTATVLASACLIAMLGVSMRAHWQYRTEAAGVFEALRAMNEDAARRPPAAVLMHRRVWAETRRAREVLPLVAVDAPRPPPSREWMAARSLLNQERVHAWWLVDPVRGDRAAVDPKGLILRERYRWPSPIAALLGGMRPHHFEWFSIDTPSWVLDDGWALTPELAGLSHAAGAGPSSSVGAQATVRATVGARTLLVGGRHVDPSVGVVGLQVSVGEAWQATESVAPGAFHRVWTLPAAALDVPLPVAAETLTVRTGTGVPAHAIALEQFDIQPAGVPVTALGAGWFEPERDVVTGRRWRWMAPRAQVEIWGADCDLRMTISGTWPRHYASAQVLSVRSGEGVLFTGAVSRPFTVMIDVPRQAQQGGRIVLDLVGSESFLAGARTGTADPRRLAIEIGELLVMPATGGRSCVSGR